MNFKKILSVIVLMAMIFSPLAFADMQYEEGGVNMRTSQTVCGTGITCTKSDGKVTMVSSNGDTTGDLTFQTSLLANGRAGGASTMSSSSTFLSTAGIAFSVINKRVGGGGGLDGDGRGSILPNGTNGQVITFIITALQSGGTWVLTPTTGWNWNKATFDAVEDSLTMLWVNSVGWIIQHNTSVTIVRNQLP